MDHIAYFTRTHRVTLSADCHWLLWEESPVDLFIFLAAAGVRQTRSQVRNCWELTSGTIAVPQTSFRSLSPPIADCRGIAGPSFRFRSLCRIISRRKNRKEPRRLSHIACNQCPFFLARFRATVPCILKTRGATHYTFGRFRQNLVFTSACSIFAEVVAGVNVHTRVCMHVSSSGPAV